MRLEILLQPSLEHATYLRYIIPFVLNHLSLFVLCEAQCIPHGSAQTLLTSTVSPMCLIDSSTVSHYTMSCNYLFVSALPGRRSTSQEPVRQALSVGSLSAITSMPRCRWWRLDGSRQPLTPLAVTTITRWVLPLESAQWGSYLGHCRTHSLAAQRVVHRPAAEHPSPGSSWERQTIMPYLRPTKSTF